MVSKFVQQKPSFDVDIHDPQDDDEVEPLTPQERETLSDKVAQDKYRDWETDRKSVV